MFVVLVAQRYRSLPPHNKQKATGSNLEAAPTIFSWYGYSFVPKTCNYPVITGQTNKINENNNNHLKCKLIWVIAYFIKNTSTLLWHCLEE